MRHLLAVLAAVLLLAAPARAEDTAESRLAAAKRYAATYDFAEIMGQSINQMALNIPADKRDAFVTLMNKTIDIGRLERFSIALMSEMFTTEELNALADFYSTPVGQSIFAKMPQMTAAMVPFIQNEIVGTIKRLQEEERRRKKNMTN